MKQYNIRVANTTKVVLTIIFVPLFVVPVIVLEAIYGPKLPDWLLITEIIILIGLALAATLFVLKKIMPMGVVTVNADSFTVDFPQKSMFTPDPFEIKMRQVENFYLEGSNGLYYMSFSTSVYPYSFNIEARSKKEEDINTILELIGVISGMVEENNIAKKSQTVSNEVQGNETGVITSVTMYEKPWAKILLVVSGLVFIGVFFMAVFMPGSDSVPWWRMGALLAFGLPFGYKVYYHNYKKKK